MTPAGGGAGDPVLIVGATGILRPAALTLAAGGHRVIAVARRQSGLTELVSVGGEMIVAVAADVFDDEQLGIALAARGIDPIGSALVYLAGGDDQTQNAAIDRISRVVDGTVVRVLTSRWTPAAPPDLANGRWPRAPARRHLMLGTRVSAATDERWHSADEISAAALEVLRTGMDAVLGQPLRSAV